MISKLDRRYSALVEVCGLEVLTLRECLCNSREPEYNSTLIDNILCLVDIFLFVMSLPFRVAGKF